MHIPGDKYRVFYSEGCDTLTGSEPLDRWLDAKEVRNSIFHSRRNVRAAWVMKYNPSLNTVPGLYGSTLRRTKYETR